MAKWSANAVNWTPALVGDASNFTNAGYMALQGGSSSQLIYVSEVYVGGLATVQSPMALTVAIDHVVGASSVSFSGGYNAALDRATAALAAPPVALNTSTTKPQRSSTLQLLQLTFNAFGGVVRWTALEPRHSLGVLGNAADGGEISLSSQNTGTAGAVSSHFIYETL
jgi:hypothetical protein